MARDELSQSTSARRGFFTVSGRPTMPRRRAIGLIVVVASGLKGAILFKC
jgi:hypothetical protein